MVPPVITIAYNPIWPHDVGRKCSNWIAQPIPVISIYFPSFPKMVSGPCSYHSSWNVAKYRWNRYCWKKDVSLLFWGRETSIWPRLTYVRHMDGTLNSLMEVGLSIYIGVFSFWAIIFGSRVVSATEDSVPCILTWVCSILGLGLVVRKNWLKTPPIGIALKMHVPRTNFEKFKFPFTKRQLLKLM